MSGEGSAPPPGHAGSGKRARALPAPFPAGREMAQFGGFYFGNGVRGAGGGERAEASRHPDAPKEAQNLLCAR